MFRVERVAERRETRICAVAREDDIKSSIKPVEWKFRRVAERRMELIVRGMIVDTIIRSLSRRLDSRLR